MVAYLDSSAVVKLAHPERHSEALRDWLNSQPELHMVSSVLAEVEVRRALQRHNPRALPSVPGVLARLDRVELTATIRRLAAGYPHSLLRSLDAIHLATAGFISQSPSGLDAFVAYDTRLLDFARQERYHALAPGQPMTLGGQ